MEREVVRIVTPGTLTDEALLEERRDNLLASVCGANGRFGLAWLDLSTEAGQEYWAAMELMGRYAAANHALIHAYMARALGVEVLLDIENHHNFLRERGVTLLSAGLDEVPMAYKDIDQVMAAQSGLVEALTRFEPRLVKMAPSGEPPED